MAATEVVNEEIAPQKSSLAGTGRDSSHLDPMGRGQRGSLGTDNTPAVCAHSNAIRTGREQDCLKPLQF